MVVEELSIKDLALCHLDINGAMITDAKGHAGLPDSVNFTQAVPSSKTVHVLSPVLKTMLSDHVLFTTDKSNEGSFLDEEEEEGEDSEYMILTHRLDAEEDSSLPHEDAFLRTFLLSEEEEVTADMSEDTADSTLMHMSEQWDNPASMLTLPYPPPQLIFVNLMVHILTPAMPAPIGFLGADTAAEGRTNDVKAIPKTFKKFKDKMIKGIYEANVDPMTYGILDKSVRLLKGSLNHALVNTLAQNLYMFVNATVVDQVASSVPGVLMKSLTQAVPTLIVRTLPQFLVVGITRIMVDALTRSLTHTLSSSLVYTLTRPSVANYYCYYCKYYGEKCAECKQASPIDPQAAFYYSDYYAAYYSDYYATYYRNRGLKPEPVTEGRPGESAKK